MAGCALALATDGFDQLIYRWAHILGGVAWIGMLYGFLLVHQQAAAALDSEARRRMVLQVVPRTVFWFQWASLLTWASGAALLAKLYYSSGSSPLMYAATSPSSGTHFSWERIGLVLLSMVGAWLVYECGALVAGRHAVPSYLLLCALAVGYGTLLERHFELSQRAILIHLGTLLGTTMAINVWLRVAPALLAQSSALARGQTPDARGLEHAASRSRHNLYLSIPLLLLMVGVHQEALLGARPWQIPVGAMLMLGLLVGWALQRGSALVRGT